MVIVSNECTDCKVPGYPCVSEACPLLNVKHYVCDKCKNEVDEGELYYFDNAELCLDCIKNELEVVE